MTTSKRLVFVFALVALPAIASAQSPLAGTDLRLVPQLSAPGNLSGRDGIWNKTSILLWHSAAGANDQVVLSCATCTSNVLPYFNSNNTQIAAPSNFFYDSTDKQFCDGSAGGSYCIRLDLTGGVATFGYHIGFVDGNYVQNDTVGTKIFHNGNNFAQTVGSGATEEWQVKGLIESTANGYKFPDSSVQVSAAPANVTTTVAVNYTALSTDYEVIMTASGKTITLPTGVSNKEYLIKLVANTAPATLTVATTGAQTFEGGTNTTYLIVNNSSGSQPNTAPGVKFRWDSTASTWRSSGVTDLQSAFTHSANTNTQNAKRAVVQVGDGVTSNGSLYLYDGQNPNETAWPAKLFAVTSFAAGRIYLGINGGGWSTAHGVDDNDIGITVDKAINGSGAGLFVCNTNLTGATGCHIGNTLYGGIPVSLDGATTSQTTHVFNGQATFNSTASPLSVGTAIPSAATVSPTKFITHISGTTTITTITPPTGFAVANTGGCLVLIADSAWATATGGNIAVAVTMTPQKYLHVCYDNGTSLWYPQL